MFFLKPLLIITYFFFSSLVSGQDIVGGEIRYSHLSGFTYSITSVIYSKTSMGINHTGTSTALSNDITMWENTYSHTFPSNGNYNINFLDSFRISNITNILNSLNEKIELQSGLIINPFVGTNNSPTLQSSPTAISISGGNFTYNVNAIDNDGDSLSYSLIPASASNYSFPAGAVIDSITGDFSMPLLSGFHAIAIKIDEWRLGTIIGSTVREMIIDSNLVTSIKNETHMENIKIFPNPNTGLFKIELNDMSDVVEVNIFNIAGKLIFSKKHNDNTLNIDISHQPKGIYLVKVVNENQVTVQKIIYD